MKMMVQGIMTNPIELCNKSYPGYKNIRRKHTWYFMIDKEKVVDQKRLYAETVSRLKNRYFFNTVGVCKLHIYQQHCVF